jgi:foldase protein PrsA
MTKKLLPVLALLTVAVALVVTGCGSGVPSNSVATVDGTPIKKAEFDHWLSVAARQSVAPGSTATPAVPDPPTYAKCVAALQNQPTPKGQTKPSVAALKAQCQQQYNGLKTQVMQFLIQSQWLLKEADARNLTAKPAAVQKQLDDQIKQSFPKKADFNKFLKTSGMTMQDLLFRVKVDVLTQQVRQKVVAGKDKVSPAAISAYYNKNKTRFAQPERRDLLVVLTKTKAKADQAKAALQSGTAWKTVAKKYSIDQASKAQGGKLPGVAKGQQEKSFDSAIFSAKKNVIVGPVKTQFGYYVFKVTNITAASQQTEQQAHDTIVNLLRSQQEQTAINNFVKDYQKKYKGKTDCAKDFVIDSCKNAPKTKTSTAPVSGAAPQQTPATPSTTPAPSGTTGK